MPMVANDLGKNALKEEEKGADRGLMICVNV